MYGRFENFILFLTAAPSPPEGPLEVKDITRNSATLTWKESKDDGGSPITAYLIEQKEAWKSTWSYVEKKKAPATSIKLTHLTEGTEYIVRVKAENKAGQSEPLESEKFKPKHMFGECSDFILRNAMFLDVFRRTH